MALPCPECSHSWESHLRSRAQVPVSMQCQECECNIRVDKGSIGRRIAKRRKPYPVVQEGAGIVRRRQSQDLDDHALPGGLPGHGRRR